MSCARNRRVIDRAVWSVVAGLRRRLRSVADASDALAAAARFEPLESRVLMARVEGIDVSQFQGTIDWTQVRAAGKEFAFQRATIGGSADANNLDSKLSTNVPSGAAAGVLMGVYHRAAPDASTNDAVNEANWFLTNAAQYIGTGWLRPALDIEGNGGLSVTAMSQWISDFSNTIQAATGVIPIIYSNATNATNSFNSTVATHDLWLARYNTGTVDPQADQPQTPSGFNNPYGVWNVPVGSTTPSHDSWSFWQYSNTGTVAGISGNVDLDVFQGDRAQLTSQFLIPASSFQVGINFGPYETDAPSGYINVADQLFGNILGYQMGWTVAGAVPVTRPGGSPPDSRYRTYVRPGYQGVNRSFEIAVPNGTYRVRVVAGSPDEVGSTTKFWAEGVSIINGVTNSVDPFLSAVKTVEVTDGRLTISSDAATAANSRLAFVDIVSATRVGVLPAAPANVSATPASSTAIDVRWFDNADNEGRDPSTFGSSTWGQVNEGYQIERRQFSGGSWGSWSTIAHARANAELYQDKNLSASTQYQYRVTAVNSIGSSATIEGDAVTTAANDNQQTYTASGDPWQVPALIQAEDFDRGGPGVAFSDTSTGSAGGYYRDGSADGGRIGNPGLGTPLVPRAHRVGWFRQGEWVEYTVDVPATGAYSIQFRVSVPGSGAKFHATTTPSGGSETNLAGPNPTDRWDVPNTGDWDAFQTITKTVQLSAGVQVIRVYADLKTGSNPGVMDFDWFRIGGGIDLQVAGLLEEQEESDGRYIPINSNANENNRGPQGELRHDNEPDATAGHRMVATDDEIESVTLVFDGPSGLLNGASYEIDFTNASKVIVWRDNGNGTFTRIQPGSSFSLTGATTVNLKVEGISLSGRKNDVKLTATLTPAGGGTASSDTIAFTVGGVDVDIDSDNNNALDRPDSTLDEGRDEEDETLPGKLITANSHDLDGDGVLDFADGYNRDGINGNADDAPKADNTGTPTWDGEHLVPIVVQTPKPLNLSLLKLRFEYDGSDPLSATGTAPAAGYLRVWKSRGVARNGNGVGAGGDYVVPNTVYTPAQLGITTLGEHELYLEAVRASGTDPNTRRLKLWGDPEGKGQWELYDWAMVTASDPGQPADVPVVTITPTDSTAAEQGQATATFTVSLDRPVPANGLSVTYTVTGTARSFNPDVDYSTSPTIGRIDFAFGDPTSKTITITPNQDTLVEGNESVTFTLDDGNGYLVGTQNAATATIADDDSPPPPAGTSAFFNSDGAVFEGQKAVVRFAEPAGASEFRYWFDFNNNGSFDGLDISNSTQPWAEVPASFLPDGPATLTVRGRITDASGNNGTNYTTQILVLNAQPTVSFTTTVPTSVATSTPVSFSFAGTDVAADSSSNFTYRWVVTRDGEALFSGTDDSVEFTPTSNGGYHVLTQVIDEDGAVGGASAMVNVTTSGGLSPLSLSTAVAMPAYYGDPTADAPGGVAFGADGGDPASLAYSGAARYADGAVHFSSSDLDPAEGGILSGHTRTWSSDPERSAGHSNGDSWVVSQWPTIRQESANVFAVVQGGRITQWFDWNTTTSTFTTRFFGHEKLLRDGSGYRLVDSQGNSLYFHSLSGGTATAPAGRLARMIDAAGNETVVTYASSEVETVKRKKGIGLSAPVLEELSYVYGSGRLTDVTMKRDVDTSPGLDVVRSVHYDYDTGAGGVSRLRFVTVKLADGTTIAERKYYRYDANNQLTHVVEGASLERLATAKSAQTLTALDALTWTDSDVKVHANYIFAYMTDGSGRLDAQTIQGLGTYNYDYETPSSHGDAFNNWKYKTIEYLPDGTDGAGQLADNDKNVVYTNYAGEVVASQFFDVGASGSPSWTDAYQYDDQGRLVLAVQPSGVSGINESNTHPATLDTDGLFHTYEYFTPPDNKPAVGYLERIGVKRQSTDTPIELSSYDYRALPSGSGFLLARETVQRAENGGSPIHTSYQYDFHTSTLTTPLGNITIYLDGVKKRVTTIPPATTDHNGDGSSAVQTTEEYDVFGRTTKLTDEDGFVHTTAYADATGAVKETIVDVGGLALKTTIVSDGLGRPTEIKDPKGQTTGKVTTIAYGDKTEFKEVKTTPPTLAGGQGQHAPPVEIVRTDRRIGQIDVFTVVAGGTQVRSLARTQLNAENQVESEKRFESTATLTYSATNGITGTLGSAYTTEYGYDARERRDKVKDALGTITRTVYDDLDRPIETWVGTNDADFTPGDTSDPNLVRVGLNQYDGGGVGDGNLTKITASPEPGTTASDRVTEMRYDWRNRMVLTHAGAGDANTPITFCEYDNLDRCVALRTYDGTGESIASLNLTTIDTTLAGDRRAFTETRFDNRGRTYRVLQHSVDQTSGTDQGSLRTDTWFDHRDNVIKTRAPGGVVTKVQYDHANRATKQFVSDGGGDLDWLHADDVNGDIVLEQVETQYDANGNVLFTISKQRHHDAITTGELQNDSTNPKARVSFAGTWYDDADRPIQTVDYGNNGGTAMANRPTTPPGRANTDGFEPHLRTDFAYDDAGRLQDVTGPRDFGTPTGPIVTRTNYDDLGRVKEVWEAYVDNDANPATAPIPGTDTNRGTLYSYNGNDQITAVESRTHQRNQTTQYTYGVTKNATNQLNHNGLLKEIVYPPTAEAVSSVTHKETFSGYNALGELTEKKERNTSTHEYTYDDLGRMLTDTWTATDISTSLISSWATSLEYQYDALGRGTMFTTKNGTTTLNQVKREYDGFGHLAVETQDHDGAVNASSPRVQYLYSNDFNANHSRPTGIVYPNGREVSYEYKYHDSGNATLNALNNAISRVGMISDGRNPTAASQLESYDYLGASRVVGRYFNSSVSLGVVYYEDGFIRDNEVPDDGGTGDPYDGLDRYGRVLVHDWGTSSVRQYAYDADGNVLFSRNPITFIQESWRSDLFHKDGAFGNVAYDRLGRMQEYQRGVMTKPPGATRYNTSVPTTSAPADHRNMTWTVDPATGNYSLQNVPIQSRAIFQRDVPNGNAFTPTVAPSDPRRDIFVRFDAWGRLQIQKHATLVRSGTQWAYQQTDVYSKEYEYDALGRRIVEDYVTDDTRVHMYYDAAGNVIQDGLQRGTTAEIAENQYVWSLSGPDMMVLRDRNDDRLESGDLGFARSGLEQRVWVLQGPDASVWETRLEGGSGLDFEEYLYTPEGEVTIVRRNSFVNIDYAFVPNSTYSWRYFWRAGRASFDHQAGVERYDGLIYLNGREHDTLRGAPLEEDRYAYNRTQAPASQEHHKHSHWTYVQTQTPGNGTGSWWSKYRAAVGHMASSLWDEYRNPSSLSPLSMRLTSRMFSAFADIDEVEGQAQAERGNWIRGGLMNFAGGVGRMLAGIADPVPGIKQLAINTAAVNKRQGANFATWYAVGSVVGWTPLAEGLAGEDFATGERLGAGERGGRFFGGVSALTLTAAGGFSKAGINPRIQLPTRASAPRLFAMGSGCFVAGTQVLVADDALLLAEVVVEEDEMLESATVPAGSWDHRVLLGSLACFAVAGVGFYFLWDSRRRRFLLDLKTLQDEIEPLEMPLRFA